MEEENKYQNSDEFKLNAIHPTRKLS